MAGISNIYRQIVEVDSDNFYPTQNFWPALTTSFTFASHCTDNWRIEHDFPHSNDDVLGVTLSMPSDCLESGGQAIHSPGTCLSGFTMVDLTEYRTRTWTADGVRAWGANCCKRGFWSSVGACVSTFTTPLTVYNAEQTGGSTTSDGSVWYFVSTNLDSRNNSTVISKGVATMDAMFVYWQASDLRYFDAEYASELGSALLQNKFAPSAAATTTRTATTLGTETGAVVPPDHSQLASATSTANQESGPEKNDNPSQSGLGTGIKAGIAVGAGVGAILLLLVAFLLYKRVAILQRRARLDQETAKQNEQPEFVPVKGGGEEEGAYTALPSSNARWSAFLAKL